MLERASEALARYASQKKIAVAVSGGADSMCLLHLVLCCPQIRREDVLVVNVDHKIRGETAARDSAFVRHTCEESGVRLNAYVRDVPARCQTSGESAETAAREVRREIFREILQGGEADLLLTAHHKNDDAETVFMHLLRGCGLSGLRGMPLLSGDGILRPLLETERKEIDAYNQKYGVSFVCDESNADSAYTRNFIRNEVFPLLNARFDSVSALCGLARRASEDDDFINAFVREDAVRCEQGCVRVKSELFAQPALAYRYAAKMLQALGERDYDETALQSVVKAASLQNGKRVCLCRGLRAAAEYGFVTLFRERDVTKKCHPFSVGRFAFGQTCAVVEPCAPCVTAGALAADADKIPAGAVIRTRQPGDVFQPYGGGEKKLKEYLIDKKIPLRLRDNLPLVCYNNKTLAVFGVEISDEIKLDSATTSAVRLTIEQEDEKRGK